MSMYFRGLQGFGVKAFAFDGVERLHMITIFMFLRQISWGGYVLLQFLRQARI